MKAKTRILVVDDTKSILVSIATILDDGCYDIVTAGDGREAWELIGRGEKFDLIISDYQMPQMNGINLLLNVRNNPRTSNTPFILISGGSVQASLGELEEMCARYGATFLPKPFAVTGLVGLVESASSFK